MGYLDTISNSAKGVIAFIVGLFSLMVTFPIYNVVKDILPAGGIVRATSMLIIWIGILFVVVAIPIMKFYNARPGEKW